jgi:hypothetical protein
MRAGSRVCLPPRVICSTSAGVKIEKNLKVTETRQMKITLTNQTKQLLIITLNSGTTLHLPPSGSSAPVEELEINDNAKIAKLLNAGAVRISRN